MNPRLSTRFVHPARCAATLGLALAFAAPAVAQWKTNPLIEYATQNMLGNTSDVVRLEMEGCAFVLQPDLNGDVAIQRSDRKGYAPQLGPEYWSDGGFKIAATDVLNLVGCKIGPQDFVLAYTGVDWSNSESHTVRVARIHWDPTNDSFSTVAGFPVTISTEPNTSDLAITPNETGTGIDGVWVAWHTTSAGQRWIHQQGVYGAGAPIWGPLATYPDGILLDPADLETTALSQPPSIVSTGDGLAVTTYHKGALGSQKHWTTKFDLTANPVAGFGPQPVAGQVTKSPSRCSVASDGTFGALYGFATDDDVSLRTHLVVARKPAAGAATSWAFWDSWASGGGHATTPDLRAMSFLALPGPSALLVYRDRTAFRCIDFSPSFSILWTRHVRGASSQQPNHDDAAATLNAGVACVVSVTDADVVAEAFAVDGTELWERRINGPTPVKAVAAVAPTAPHVFATGGPNSPGFMLAWTDGAYGDYYIAERIAKSGVSGLWYFYGGLATAYDLSVAATCNTQCAGAAFVTSIGLDLAEPPGMQGVVEVRAAIGTSYVGIENNPAAWTLMASGNVVSAGPGKLTTLTLSTPIALPAGINALMVRAVGLSIGSSPTAGGMQTFDLGDLTVQCGATVSNWPNGPVHSGRAFHGSFDYGFEANPAPPATHTAYGAGCYAMSNSFYSHFANASAAAAALTGQSMRMIPIAGNQYQVVWGGGTYVAPTGSASPVFFSPNDDDGIAVVLLPTPIPIAGGVATSLVVHSNGGVWVDDNQPALLPNDYTPRAASMLAAPYAGFWSWHDYNPSEPGSGQVMLDGGPNGEIYITWQDVESYPLGTANRSTMQFQIDATGAVTWVWPTINGNSTSPYGSGHLVGYSPGGASIDGGSLALPTALPLQTSAGLLPLTLGASPAPIAGTTVTYNTSNFPEAIPGSGVYIGLFIISFGSIPGIDLGFLGAPGCLLHVASLDLTVAMVGFSSTQSVALPLPAGVPAGTLLFTQSAALVTPGTLNAFGLVTSNGLQSRIGN